MRLLEKFSIAVENLFKPAEFPQTMKSMKFHQPHDIHYTETVYGYYNFFQSYTLKEPKETSKTVSTNKYTQHEARRVSDKDGYKYTIHTIEQVTPNLYGKKDVKETKFVFENNNPLLTKEQALAELERLEQKSLRDTAKTIDADAKETRGHYSRYIPLGVAQAAPSARPKNLG